MIRTKEAGFTLLFLRFSLIIFCVAGLAGTAAAQSDYQPYSYSLYQKLDPVLYSPHTRMHTTIKPLFRDDSLLRPVFDSIFNVGVDTSRKTWFGRKLLNEHLIDIRKDEYRFYADFLPDLQIGRELNGKSNTWLNTRGYQIGLNIGDKFSLYTSGYENQAVFAPYVQDFISTYKVVPGQTSGEVPNRGSGSSVDYSYVSAIMTYTPAKYLNISLAYDKNFIGDGYRSMFLSDVSSNYTSLKLTGNIGNVQYLSMWSYMIDPMAPVSEDRGTASRYKWGAFQFLDWNISKRVSLGLFQGVIWSPQNSDGTSRGFNFNYINPVIFIRPLESVDAKSPDKIHLGISGKYKLLERNTIYGQFKLDEFTAKEFFANRGYWANKWGAQIGVKGFDAFGVKNLHYLAEYNLARPYTYAHFQTITAYTNFSQPLAHPYGANFRELLSVWNYSYKRFDFYAQGIYARYGLDMNGLNYGKDLFKSYDTVISTYGNFIGQGLLTSLKYMEGRVSYVVNPKYNLRIEAGGVIRTEKNALGINRTALFTLGLRSSFRHFYYDF
ncbi:MAG: gliding motility protein RemB [Mucilaginibacter polytrichastri]|nr:gliding motility protein RemB [Mucilaginibacter polytrichastri]